MANQTDFSRLDAQYDIHLTLQMETPLRIGVSKDVIEYSISSAPVLLSYDAEKDTYMPFIPGSSLKGVMRSAAERLLKTNFYNGDWTAAVKKAEDFSNSLFGSVNARSKVTVTDFIPEISAETSIFLKDRPHVKPELKWIKGKKKWWANFRTEEVVEPMEFSGVIRVDNPDEGELRLLNMVIKEFESRRLQIGGATSRGNGFVSPFVDKVVKKTVEGLELREEIVELPEIIPNKKYSPLDCTNSEDCYPKDKRRQPNHCCGFEAYATSENRGAVVYEFTVRCMTDFSMPGVGEDTVTMNNTPNNTPNTPVIPGSTIKGFLRKELKKKWKEDIDDTFGSIRGPSAHASRVVVSDAFFWEEPEKKPEGYIPEGSELTCWIFFDNMEFGRIKEILDILTKENRITGSTSAKRKPNRVLFKVGPAWRYMPDDPEKVFELP